MRGARRTERRPPQGEARASGEARAGELLCSVARGSSSESEGGSSSRSEQSEGDSKRSSLSSGGSENDARAIRGGAEAETYKAREQSERRSESASGAKHENRKRKVRRSPV